MIVTTLLVLLALYFGYLLGVRRQRGIEQAERDEALERRSPGRTRLSSIRVRR